MGALQAGAATANITPWLGVTIPGGHRPGYADDVHDELLAKALVLDNGHTRVAFITCDLIAMPRNIADRARQRVAQRCGIPIENTMINATHTHSGGGIADLLGTDGDSDYIEWLHLKIADAAELACRRLRPARIGFASVEEDRIAFNRRWRMKDGTVRMNPGVDNPDLIEPSGPTDPELAMAYVEDLNGDPMSAIASYSLHYIGAGGGISADYFGHFFRQMRRYLGGECVPLLWNAASGQINNIDFSGRRRWKDSGHAHAKKMANVLAGHMLTEIQLMDMQDSLDLAAATGSFDFSPRTITPEDLEMAEIILASPDDPPEYDKGPFSWVRGSAHPAVYRGHLRDGMSTPGEAAIQNERPRAGIQTRRRRHRCASGRGLRRVRPGNQDPDVRQSGVCRKSRQRLHRLHLYRQSPYRGGRIRNLGGQLLSGRRGHGPGHGDPRGRPAGTAVRLILRMTVLAQV